MDHGGGHFAPQWWPWAEITKFIVAQALPVEDPSEEEKILTEIMSLEARLEKLVDRSKAPGIKQYTLPPLYSSNLREMFGIHPNSITC